MTVAAIPQEVILTRQHVVAARALHLLRAKMANNPRKRRTRSRRGANTKTTRVLRAKMLRTKMLRAKMARSTRLDCTAPDRAARCCDRPRDHYRGDIPPGDATNRLPAPPRTGATYGRIGQARRFLDQMPCCLGRGGTRGGFGGLRCG